MAVITPTLKPEHPNPYLEGQEDLVSRLISLITHLIILATLFINLLAKSPDPPSILSQRDPETRSRRGGVAAGVQTENRMHLRNG